MQFLETGNGMLIQTYLHTSVQIFDTVQLMGEKVVVASGLITFERVDHYKQTSLNMAKGPFLVAFKCIYKLFCK